MADGGAFHDDAARVCAKEDQLAEGCKALTALRREMETLHMNMGTAGIDPEADMFYDQHNSFRKACSNLEICIGIGGDTGFGKTSLLNALIEDDKEVVPSSQHKACTAAVCLFRYNRTIDPARLYRAEVVMKSLDSVVNDLAEFFGEWDDIFSIDPEDSDDGVAVRTQQNQLKQNLRFIESWSGLSDTEIHRLRGGVATIDQIIHKSKTRVSGKFNLIDTSEGWTLNISAPKAPQFLRDIKPYIDSSMTPTGANARELLWPLVEYVNIYVKSDLLKPGLVLVDLPGERDTVAARSQVTKGFYSTGRLDKMLVVTHAIRGLDNSTSVELIMSENQILDLEAEEKLTKENLCVVVTKTDDLDCRQFLENWDAAPAELLEKRDELEAFLLDDDDDNDGSQDSEGKEPDDNDDEKGVNNSNDKRAFTTKSSPTKHRPTKRRKLSKYDTERKQAELEAVIKKACVQERNRELAATIKDNIKLMHKTIVATPPTTAKEKKKAARKARRAQKAREKKAAKEAACKKPSSSWSVKKESLSPRNASAEDPTGTEVSQPVEAKIADISVLPVSSLAYRSILEKGRVPMMGFETVEDTGIPQLKAWITNASLEKREVYVDAMLRQCSMLFDALDSMANGLATNLQSKKLTAAQRDAVYGLIDTDIKQFTKTLEMIRNRLYQNHNTQYPIKLAIKFPTTPLYRIVKRFAFKNSKNDEPVHWGTYGACVRRRGGKHVRCGKEKATYHWIGSINTKYWSPRALKWAECFTARIKKSRERETQRAKQSFEKYMARITDSAGTNNNKGGYPPAFVEVVKSQLYKLANISDVYIDNMMGHLEVFRGNGRLAKAGTMDELQGHMNEAFDQARVIKGKGRLLRQMDILEAHAEAKTANIWQDVDSHVSTQVKKNLKLMKSEMRHTTEKFLCDFKQQQKNLARLASGGTAHRADGKKHTSSASVLSKDARVKRTITDMYGKWRSDMEALRKRLPEATPVVIDDDDEEEDEEYEEDDSDELAYEDGCQAKDAAPVRPGVVVKSEPGVIRSEPEV